MYGLSPIQFLSKNRDRSEFKNLSFDEEVISNIISAWPEAYNPSRSVSISSLRVAPSVKDETDWATRRLIDQLRCVFVPCGKLRSEDSFVLAN